MKKLTNNIIYAGVDDCEIGLFENQYPVVQGVSYNSYVIMDEKIAVMDAVDEVGADEWLNKLDGILDGRTPDYIVVSHLEPDHSAGIARFMCKYPKAIIVGNDKTFAMLAQFTNVDMCMNIDYPCSVKKTEDKSAENIQDKERRLVVKEGDVLSLGVHKLMFYMAPMVHWPEVMVCYEMTERILFSADAFGMFGVLKDNLFSDNVQGMPQGWSGEARRYYANIVGKYGNSVQMLLKKLACLEIHMIAPLHGLVLKGDIDYYLEKYDCWSRYEAEEEGVVIAYSTLHGNTRAVVETLAQFIKEKNNEHVAVFDLSKMDVSYVLAAVFRWNKLVLAGVTWDGGLMPCMEDLLYHLTMKNVQNRKIAIIENGSWAPMAGKHIRQAVEKLKNIEIYDNTITIKTCMNTKNKEELSNLSDWL